MPDRERMICDLRCGYPKGEPASRQCGGYIIERIVASHSQCLCFDGMLSVCGLPACLCPPFTLCDVDVACIEPCAQHPGACCMPCAAAMLRFTLLCHVVDSRGQRGQGQAVVELAAQQRCGDAGCGANIRRGARVRLVRACFCPPCAFKACLYMDLRTVVSQCEMIGTAHCPSRACPPLPIYPNPAQLPCGHEDEHFRVFSGKKT